MLIPSLSKREMFKETVKTDETNLELCFDFRESKDLWSSLAGVFDEIPAPALCEILSTLTYVVSRLM